MLAFLDNYEDLHLTSTSPLGRHLISMGNDAPSSIKFASCEKKAYHTYGCLLRGSAA
ncbi:hypothetical protein HPP92_013467 [Vanilla planifolia]|uniref:Uncharacterized protein n=1 Tax=Vanilla planifolia TaxID=51239 RepID=A0A835UYU5_VANPL|nr:hypothetical protein HPP92_013467 [Vanilla planifolia]